MDNNKNKEYKIVPFKTDDPYIKRWAIQIGGIIVDDAQGYGYKTKEGAHKSAWYKYFGGELKLIKKKKNTEKFKKNSEKFFKMYNQITKKINSGETNAKDIIEKIEKQLDIEVPAHLKKVLINNRTAGKIK